jgi:hypothetical protein
MPVPPRSASGSSRRHLGRWFAIGTVLAAIAAFLPMTLAAVPVRALPLDSLPDAGVLRLHLGSAPQQWRYEPAQGSAVTQAVGISSGCRLAPTSGALVSLTPVPASGTVGLTTDGIGIRSSGEGGGVPCGRVDGDKGQQLKVSLTGPGLSNALADFMELDIEAKGDVIVVADLFFRGDPVGSFELPTGTRSDSGPDSADGDNYRFRVPTGQATTAFDAFVLRPKDNLGAFSLAGGADGTAPEPGGLGEELNTSDSVIHLKASSGILDCGDSTGNVTGGDTTANFTRGENPNCVPIPYLLRVENDDVLVQKDITGQPDANFTMTVTWDAEPAPPDGGTLSRQTLIDYTPETPGDATPLLWCEAGPTPPAGEFWCLTAQTSELQPDGTVVVTENLFGEGDPRVTRR